MLVFGAIFRCWLRDRCLVFVDATGCQVLSNGERQWKLYMYLGSGQLYERRHIRFAAKRAIEHFFCTFRQVKQQALFSMQPYR